MSKRGQVKPSVDAGGPDGDYTTKVSWRIESGKRIIEKVERIAPTPPTADETPAPTTAYVTCPDCKAIHQLGKCREYAYSAPPQPSETQWKGLTAEQVKYMEAKTREWWREHGTLPDQPTALQINSLMALLQEAEREGLERAAQLADPEKYTCEDSCSVGKVRDAIQALKVALAKEPSDE